MTPTRCIAVVFSIFSVTAYADDNAAPLDLPVGVIVYDTVAPSNPTATPAPTVMPGSAPVVVAPLTQSPASTRSSFAQPFVGTPVQSGTVLDQATIAPQINLAPGETVLQAIAAPSAIVRIPDPQPAYTLTSGPPPASRPARRAAPEPVVDPVTGRLRDTPGWTGRREGPASIGCFPAGACAVLNQR